MAHVAIAARLDSLAAKDRRIANALEALAHATGTDDEDMEELVARHRQLASDLAGVATLYRDNSI